MIFARLSKGESRDFEVFKKRATDIQDVSLLTHPLTEYRKNRLYVKHPSLEIEKLEGILPDDLLIPRNDGVFYTGRHLENQMTRIFNQQMDPTELIESIQDVLLFYRKMFSKLLTAIESCSGLQELTDIISDMLANPVSVFARGLKLLAHSKAYSMDYKPWHDSERKGYLVIEAEFSKILEKQALIADAADCPFIFFQKGMNYPVGVAKLNMGGTIGVFHVVGYNNPITDVTLDIMNAVRVYLSLEFIRSNLVESSHRLLQENMLIDLIENKVDSLDALRTRYSEVYYGLSEHIQLLTLKPVSQFLIGTQLSQINKIINGFLPFSYGVVYKRSIVVMISNSKGIPFEYSTKNRLLALLKDHDLCCGQSVSSTSVLEVSKLYKQSLQAIKLGLLNNPGNSIYRYTDYILEDFFDHCVESETGITSSALFGALETLECYDSKRNDSMLMDTLINYLDSGCNQNQAAQQLYIHRSTMLYRLKRIEEVAHIDLNDSDTIFQITLALKLRKFESKYRTEK
jgi:sugar diacid utilization regulator